MQSEKSTQDDSRESQQQNIFKLIPTKGRSNKYIPDATIVEGGREYKVELKTRNIKKSDISTARSFNLKKLNEYRLVPIWIFSEFKDRNILTGEHYVLTSAQMSPIFDKLEKKIYEGTKRLAGLNDWNQAKKALKPILSEPLLSKLNYAFEHKGVALNDPKIPWSQVTSLGTKIKTAIDLRKFIKKELT